MEEKINQCIQYREEAFGEIQRILERIREPSSEEKPNILDIYEKIETLKRYLNIIYQKVKEENYLKSSYSKMNRQNTSLSMAKKNVPKDAVLVSLLHLQHLKSAVTVLVHLCVVPLIIKGLRVPSYKPKTKEKVDNGTQNEQKRDVNRHDDPVALLRQIEGENRISSTWSCDFIKDAQFRLYQALYKKKKNKMQKELLWETLDILWKLLLPLPVHREVKSNTKGNISRAENRSIFYVSVVDFFPFIIAGTLQLAYRYKNRHTIAYVLTNTLLFAKGKSSENAIISCGDDETSEILDMLKSPITPIPIETIIDSLLTLISIQGKDTFGETIINQVLSHILIKYDNGLELFSTHFLGDMALETLDDKSNAKNKELSLLKVVELLTTVPKHIVLQFRKNASGDNVCQSDAKIAYYYEAFYCYIFKQAYNLYINLYRSHKWCVGVKLCIYLFEQVVTKVSEENVDSVMETDNSFVQTTSFLCKEFLSPFFKTILNLETTADLLNALNSSRPNLENEILLLSHYTSATPIAFTQSMRYILSQLYHPMMRLYIYAEKRRLVDSALFELTEKTFMNLIQKTCACMCHTRDDYVLLSRYILNTTSNSIQVLNNSKIKIHTNEAVSIDDASKFIVSLMMKNNQPDGNKNFMKTSSLNGYIYVEVFSSSSGIHEEIMQKMKAKNDVLWEAAGDNVIRAYNASNSLNYNDDVITQKSTEGPVNANVRQQVNALDLGIQKLEVKQKFMATIMMLITNPDSCEDMMISRPNNILVDIMKHNATVLLRCIVMLFKKIVEVVCPEMLTRGFGKNGIHGDKLSNVDVELRNIENKYRYYVYESGTNTDKNNSSEEYENTINIGLSLLGVLLRRPNQRDVSRIYVL